MKTAPECVVHGCTSVSFSTDYVDQAKFGVGPSRTRSQSGHEVVRSKHVDQEGRIDFISGEQMV
jgi:hypothetical protein